MPTTEQLVDGCFRDILQGRYQMAEEIITTNVMLRALAYAKENGGKLTRYPGGFWTRDPWHQEGKPPAITFGASTVAALVRRGRMTYTKFQTSGQGRGEFPIEATIKEQSNGG